MDIPRQSKPRRRQFKIALSTLVTLAAIALIAFGTTRLKPAAPGVERSSVLTGTVKRGPMLREIRGAGTLVPEEVRVVASATSGRIEHVLVQPGAIVTADTVIIELVNPELQQEAMDVEYQVRAIEADANNLRVRLESERLTQEANAASVQADYQQAKLQAETDEALAKDGLYPALNLKLSKLKAEELANRYRIEQKRIEVNAQSVQAQLAAQQARVTQLRALLSLKRSQVAALRVVAGTDGVLQQLQVEVGQQITPGANLAKVVEPSKLKAELRIAETQAKDLQLDQQVSVDTRNGVVPGHIVRIDPAVEQGTVKVDVALDAPLPPGARPDLSVDGTVELERLADVLYVQRPAFGQAGDTVSLFKLEADGKSAVRIRVKLGRSAVNTVEILGGLQAGDQVILSDMSQWDSVERIVLN
ncbi:MAG TPA: HlyD family efflux transporter periplasmic adaptor subunit [Pyrinomonadaceae bacterium]